MTAGEADSAGQLNHAKRTHPIIYVLVTNKLATYSELKYNYDIEDFLDLYEICMVSLHNKLIAMSR